jgi:hypothetical protein
MKRILNSAMLFTAFAVLAFVMAPSARAASPHCSNATLNGSYSATITGTLGTSPFAELDLVTSTGNGTFTGTGTQSVDGTINTVSITATYTVNSNCSGSATLTVGTMTITQNFNIQPDGSEVDIISTSSGTTITAVAKRLGGPYGD